METRSYIGYEDLPENFNGDITIFHELISDIKAKNNVKFVHIIISKEYKRITVVPAFNMVGDMITYTR